MPELPSFERPPVQEVVSDVIDRHQTTMSDSDVIQQVRPPQDSSGRMSDNDWVAVSISNYAARSEPHYWWGSRLVADPTMSALQRLEQQLLSITDNWDGYCAKAPHIEAIKITLTILDSLPHGMSFPDVYPGTNGDVILEWESPDAEVLLVIESANRIETTVDLEGSRFEGSLESLTSEVAAALHKIASSA